ATRAEEELPHLLLLRPVGTPATPPLGNGGVRER
ncbi:unnamed protein product, partial [Urochloa humidicola]